MMNVVIINYGSGNLRSAAKAIERTALNLKKETKVNVTKDPEIVLKADRLVLPGVGAFASCLRGLSAIKGLSEAIEEATIQRARPFLGICVGMQLMATNSLEHGNHPGFNWIPGQVESIKTSTNTLKIPHMGWNEISFSDKSHPLLEKLPINPHFYFVHSYSFCPDLDESILATTDYGSQLTAIVQKQNVVGTQFHPEKSQLNGFIFLENFLEWQP